MQPLFINDVKIHFILSHTMFRKKNENENKKNGKIRLLSNTNSFFRGTGVYWSE